MKIIQMMRMTRTQTTDRQSMASRQPHGIKTYGEHVFSQETRLQNVRLRNEKYASKNSSILDLASSIFISSTFTLVTKKEVLSCFLHERRTDPSLIFLGKSLPRRHLWDNRSECHTHTSEGISLSDYAACLNLCAISHQDNS
jgi:hypothetical protein